MKKICFVATIPAVVYAFLSGHIKNAAEQWDVSIITNSTGSELLDPFKSKLHAVAFVRKISLFQDFQALLRLIRIFRRNRFAMVHSIMPKTGLLSMVAGCVAGVPIRVHTFTGQVWATKKGAVRYFLKLFDRLIVLFSTHVVVDSPSQRMFLVSEGVLKKDQATVVGKGSICGVDCTRFCSDFDVRKKLRQEYGISSNQTVILFLGRLNRDKGVLDLAKAFDALVSKGLDAILFYVGAEEDVSFSDIVFASGFRMDLLRRVPFTPDPERFMAMADIFCLPSYREGFGQVVIEAAGCGIPAVASRIYGITDAIEDGKSGLLFPSGDIAALTCALARLIEDPIYRRQLGAYAQSRVVRDFSSEHNNSLMMSFYSSLLGK